MHRRRDDEEDQPQISSGGSSLHRGTEKQHGERQMRLGVRNVAHQTPILNSRCGGASAAATGVTDCTRDEHMAQQQQPHHPRSSGDVRYVARICFANDSSVDEECEMIATNAVARGD